MATVPVKYFHSAMPGAPVLSGTPGATIAVLDACLVTGWGLKTVDSLVVAGNVATATIGTGHSAAAGSVILIAGATPPTLNGEWRVTTTTVNTVQFATAGITNQTATGAVTLKIAPAGWAKAFSGTNIAAYQPTDPASSKMYLRVDDTGTTTCRVVGYESMSSVSAGTAPFPTEAQRSGGLWWQKSSAADATARSWFLTTDGLLFYYGKHYFSNYTPIYDVGVFGETLSVKSVDPFACMLFGRGDAGVSTPIAAQQLSMSDYGVASLYVARSHSGIGASVQLSKSAPFLSPPNSGSYPSGNGSGPPYPNPADGGLYLSPLNIFEGWGLVPATLRAAFPGYYCCPQAIPIGVFGTGDPVTGVSSLPGRTLMSVQSWQAPPPNNQTSFIDITGPWR